MNNDIIIRLDKNSVYNYNYFDKHGSDTGDVLRSLLVYFSYQHQKDLFGYGILDTDAFCTMMNYKKSNLFAKHPKPHQLKDLTEIEIEKLYFLQEQFPMKNRVFDSILENALYILFKDNLIVENYISKQSLKGDSISLKSIQIIEDLEIIFRKQKGGNKIFYKYRLSPNFSYNLATYFLQANIKNISLLRKPNLDGLYLYLSNVLQEMKNKNISSKIIDFDTLADFAKIDFSKQRQKKAKLKMVLDKIVKETELDFLYDFEKENANSSYKYAVWIKSNNAFKDGNDKKVSQDILFENLFKEELNRELLLKFRTIKQYVDLEKEFKVWYFFGSKENKKEKELCYKTAYFRVHGKLPDYIDNIIHSWFKDIDNKNNV